MQTTLDFLDAVKARYSLPSDYALAKTLGVSRACVSNLRNRKDIFSDQTALTVAKLLRTEPALVVASAHAERAKSPEEKAVWTTIYERLSGFPDLMQSANDGADAVRTATD